MEPLFLFLNLGGQELIIVLVVILLLFGGRKIPELMRGLGRGIREFNSARANIESDFKESIRESEKREIEEERPSSSQS